MMIFQTPQQFVESLPTRPYDPSIEFYDALFGYAGKNPLTGEPVSERDTALFLDYERWVYAAERVIGKIVQEVTVDTDGDDYDWMGGSVYGTPKLLHDSGVDGIGLDFLDDQGRYGPAWKDKLIRLADGAVTLVLYKGKDGLSFVSDNGTHQVVRFAVDLDYSKIALVKI